MSEPDWDEMYRSLCGQRITSDLAAWLVDLSKSCWELKQRVDAMEAEDG